MFICNHCPYVKAVEDRLIRLAREFEPRGVQFVGVCANDADKLSGRRLRQAGRALARARLRLSRTCTTRRRTSRARSAPSARPTSSSSIASARLAYRGRIDDSWKDESRVTRRELAEAIEALVAGRRPSPRAAAVDGVLDQMATGSLSKNGGGARARHGAARIPKGPWRTYLQRKGLKTTQQREAIVDAFLRTSGHVALEDLLSSARRKHPGVGLATVYRTVKLLEEAGIAAARHFGPGQTLYEIAEGRAHHDHLICDSCGFIIEFENDEIEALQDAAARRLGFNVLRHRHELFGLCEKARGLPGGRCPGEASGHRGRS